MKFLSSIRLWASALTIAALMLGSFGRVAFAATLTQISDFHQSVKISTATNHVITFLTPTGVDASTDTITVTFPAEYTIGTFALANVDLRVGDSGACGTATYTDKTLAVSAAASTWGTAWSGQVLTLTAPTNAASGEITANRCVKVYLGSNATAGGTGTNFITNPSSAGNYAVTVGGTFGDSGTATTVIVNDDTVAVTGTVANTLTMSMSANSIGFGGLSASAARYATTSNGSNTEGAGHTIAVATNGQYGYSLSVYGGALTYNGTTITNIGGTAAASSAGSEQFGIRLTASGGSGTAASPFNTSNYAYSATASVSNTVAASTSPSATTTFSVFYLANIANTTEAGAYSTTLNYTVAANF